MLFRILLGNPSRRLFGTPSLAEPRTASPGFANKREFVGHAYASKAVIDKSILVTSLCAGKDVLDLGCIDHSYEVAISLGDRWLHKQLKQVSRSLVGLDILEDDALRLRKEGYDIVVA